MKKINLEALKAGLILKSYSAIHYAYRVEEEAKDSGNKNIIIRLHWKVENLQGAEEIKEFKKIAKKVDIEKTIEFFKSWFPKGTLVIRDYSTSWYLFDIFLTEKKEVIDLRQKKKEISNSYCPEHALRDELKEPHEFRVNADSIRLKLEKCVKSKYGRKLKIRILYKFDWDNYNADKYHEVLISSSNIDTKYGDINKAIRFFQAREDGIIKVYEDNKGVQRLDYYISKTKLLIDLREKKEEVEEIKEIQETQEAKEAVVGGNDENLRNVIFNFEKEEGKEVVVKVWRGKKALFSDKVKVEDIKEVDNAIKANFKVWKSIQKTGASELLVWLSF